MSNATYIPFYAWIYDVNGKRFEPYDIMSRLIDEWVDQNKYKGFKKPQDFNEYKQWVKDKLRYMFWAKCEYEMIWADWPCAKTEKKVDVYEQLKPNLDVVTRIFILNL